MHRERMRLRWCLLTLAGIIVIIACLTLVGHLFDMPMLFTWGSHQIAGMAINTATAFLCIGIAIIGLLILVDE